MRETFPQVAGIYKCLREDFQYVAILKTDGHRQTWLDDALPCDKNGKALKGYLSPIPFHADEIGDFVKGLEE